MTDPKSLARDAAAWLYRCGDLRRTVDLDMVADAIYQTALKPLVEAHKGELALAQAGALAAVSELAAKAVNS